MEFDTKQILDDIQIPRGKWGTADYLEPMTKSYAQHGAGGATQAITHMEIQATRIIDLKTNRVIYGAE